MSWICASCETLNAEDHQPCEVCGGAQSVLVTWGERAAPREHGWIMGIQEPRHASKYAFHYPVKRKLVVEGWARLPGAWKVALPSVVFGVLVFGANYLDPKLAMLLFSGSILLGLMLMVAMGIKLRWMAEPAKAELKMVEGETRIDSIPSSRWSFVSTSLGSSIFHNDRGYVAYMEGKHCNITHPSLHHGELGKRYIFAGMHWISVTKEGYDSRLDICSLKSPGEVLRSLWLPLLHDPKLVTITGNGEIAVMRDDEGRFVILPMRQGNARLVTLPLHPVPMWNVLAVSDDLVTMAWLRGDGSVAYKMLNDDSRVRAHQLPRSMNLVFLHVQPGGSTAVLGDNRGNVWLMDMATGQHAQVAKLNNKVTAYAVNQTGTWLAAAVSSLVIMVRLGTHEEPVMLEAPFNKIHALTFKAPHTLVASGEHLLLAEWTWKEPAATLEGAA